MNFIDRYRARRERRIAARRLDAEEDNGWKTTEEGKHYQIDPESGEVVKGNIGIKNVKTGERPTGSADRPKRRNKADIQKELDDVNRRIFYNNMTDAGKADLNRQYREADRELQAEKERLERELNRKGKGVKRSNKKVDKILKKVRSEGVGLSPETEKSMLMRGYTEEEVGKLKDLSWYRPSDQDKKELALMVMAGSRDLEVEDEIKRRAFDKISERKKKRDEKAWNKSEREEKRNAKVVEKEKKEFEKVLKSGDKDKVAETAYKIAQDVFEPSDIKNAIEMYKQIHRGKAPYGWNDVRNIVENSITQKLGVSMHSSGGVDRRLYEEIAESLRKNGAYFMNEYKKSIS